MDAMKAALRRSLLAALASGVLGGCSTLEALQPPAVLEMVRTIDSQNTITSEDYEQLRAPPILCSSRSVIWTLRSIPS